MDGLLIFLLILLIVLVILLIYFLVSLQLNQCSNGGSLKSIRKKSISESWMSHSMRFETLPQEYGRPEGKRIRVPDGVRKETACPETIEIYEDCVKTYGATMQVFRFSDYQRICLADRGSPYTGILFLNVSANSGPTPYDSLQLRDVNYFYTNRICFYSGTFRRKDAYLFAAFVFAEIQKYFEMFRERNG